MYYVLSDQYANFVNLNETLERTRNYILNSRLIASCMFCPSLKLQLLQILDETTLTSNQYIDCRVFYPEIICPKKLSPGIKGVKKRNELDVKLLKQRDTSRMSTLAKSYDLTIT